MSHSIYLKVDGVEGEENRSNYEGWIKADYIDYPFQRHIAGFAGGNKGNVGDVEISKLSVFAPIDKAMPAIWLNFFKNKPIKKVTVAWCVNGEEEQNTMTIELLDARIIGVKFINNAATNGMEMPASTSQPMSMLYQFVAPKIKVAYTPLSLDNNRNAPVTAAWNVDTQEEF